MVVKIELKNKGPNDKLKPLLFQYLVKNKNFGQYMPHFVLQSNYINKTLKQQYLPICF